MKKSHTSVLLEESIQILDIHPGETVIDCTLGAGGHTEAFAKRVGKEGIVIGIDQNPKTLQETTERLRSIPQVITVEGNFGDLKEVLKNISKVKNVHHVFFDLGLSSMEISDPQFGGSFQKNAPLNMRFDLKEESVGVSTAATIVNTWDKDEMTRILKEYGDEPEAKKIVEVIIKSRTEQPITETRQLADLVRSVKRVRKKGIDPATATFQALRMAVNQETEVLEQGLRDAMEIIEPSGTIAVISFHSGEDRIVKKLFRDAVQGCTCSPDQPTCTCESESPPFKLLTKKPITPTKEEISQNPRSRSAKLRAIQKQ